MATFNNTKRSRDPTAPAPEVIGLLPDVPGGEPGLLPAALMGDNLKVWFTIPLYSDPRYGEEKYELFVDDVTDAIATRYWTTPIDDADRYLELPASWLRGNDGQHRIYYKATIYNGEVDVSFDLVLTLDTLPPRLASDSKLIFPLQVLPPSTLTARYLELNDDVVLAELRVYTTPLPWDCIIWYWGPTRGTMEQGGVIELDDKNYSAPVVISVPGDLIRDRGDGMRYASYLVRDRAGNESLRSEPVELDVAATPIPRTLPPIRVTGATGGSASGTLNPSNAINGATVVIPPEAVIYDGESVFVQWGEAGTPGAYRTGTPIAPGSREYRIPVDKVSHHLAKTLPVRYEVVEPGVVEPHNSQAYTLRVEMLGGPPTIQCDRVSGGRLSLASIPAGGFANFTLERWTWMGTDQFITVTVVGVDINNQSLTIPVLTGSQVPEVAQSISVGQISKTNLQRYKLNLGIEIRCSVSFDGKQSYQAFPRLTPTLVV